MGSVAFSAEARRDLLGIGDYIAQDDTALAADFVGRLNEACLELADFPRRFPISPRHGPNAHRRAFGNYVILYDVDGDAVLITAVVHAARQHSAP